jgi:hypothetical protein
MVVLGHSELQRCAWCIRHIIGSILQGTLIARGSALPRDLRVAASRRRACSGLAPYNLPYHVLAGPSTASSLQCACLQVHAEDEMEHAAIGHEAVRSFVPAELAPVVRRAMLDHDRDFASFYNAIATLLEQHCR